MSSCAPVPTCCWRCGLRLGRGSKETPRPGLREVGKLLGVLSGILLSREPPETQENDRFFTRTMIEKNGESTLENYLEIQGVSAGVGFFSGMSPKCRARFWSDVGTKRARNRCLGGAGYIQPRRPSWIASSRSFESNNFHMCGNPGHPSGLN